MSTVEKITQQYLDAAAVNSREMQVESFGFFLKDYVIEGAEVTQDVNNPRRFIITEGVLSFGKSLYRVYSDTVTLPRAAGTYFVDFTVKAGYVVNTSHPKDEYLPLWQINTDATGNITETVDLRGPMGYVQFRDEIQGIITDEVIVDEEHIAPEAVGTTRLQDEAVTEPKLSDNSVSPRTIQDDAVRTFHIIDKAVSYDKLGPDVTDLIDALQTGDSGPAANAARYNSVSGITYDTLKQRLDKEYQETTAQLAQSKQQLKSLETKKVDKEAARVKSVPIGLNDLDGEVLGAIQNGSGGSPIEVLSIPREQSVVYSTLENSLAEYLLLRADNIIANADFSQGTFMWESTDTPDSTFTVAGAQLFATANGTRSWGSVRQTKPSLFSAQNKYYVSVHLQVDNSDCQEIELFVTSPSSRYTVDKIYSPKANTVYQLNGVVGGFDGDAIYFRHVYKDEATANDKVMAAQFPLIISLTELFGLGNEPTKTEANKLFLDYEKYWYNGKPHFASNNHLLSLLWEHRNEFNKNNFIGQYLIKNGDFADANIIDDNPNATTDWRVSTGTSLLAVENSVVTFQANSKLGRLYSPFTRLVGGKKYYIFARFKSSSNKVGILLRDSPDYNLMPFDAFHSGNSDFEIVSTIVEAPYTDDAWMIGVADNRDGGWDPVEVDYINVIDLTEMFSNNIPSKTRLKTKLDNLLIVNGYSEHNLKLSPKEYFALHGTSNDTIYYEPVEVRDYSAASSQNIETMSVYDLYELWDNLISTDPHYMTKTILGKDASGEFDVWRVDLKPKAPLYKIIIQANIHGHGAGGDPRDVGVAIYHFFEDMVRRADDDPKLMWLRYNVHFIVLPCTNPWGFHYGSRFNANGVDLNRNYDSFTEIETRYVRNILLSNKDSIGFLDMHCFMDNPYPFKYPGYYVDTKGVGYKVLHEVGEYLARKNGAELQFSQSQGTNIGKNYAEEVLGINAVTIEGVAYVLGEIPHNPKMMTMLVEWYGNCIYKWCYDYVRLHDFIMAENGTKYRIKVDTDGNLATVSL